MNRRGGSTSVAIGCTSNSRGLPNENERAEYFRCDNCRATHRWGFDVHAQHELPHRCTVDGNAIEGRCDSVRTRADANRCAQSAAHVCLQCAPTRAFVLCDTCRDDAPLIHDANHVFVAALCDIFVAHRGSSPVGAFPHVHDFNAAYTWLSFRGTASPRCTPPCFVCRLPVRGMLYASLKRDESHIVMCERCWLLAIVDGKRDSHQYAWFAPEAHLCLQLWRDDAAAASADLLDASQPAVPDALDQSATRYSEFTAGTSSGDDDPVVADRAVGSLTGSQDDDSLFATVVTDKNYSVYSEFMSEATAYAEPVVAVADDVAAAARPPTRRLARPLELSADVSPYVEPASASTSSANADPYEEPAEANVAPAAPVRPNVAASPYEEPNQVSVANPTPKKQVASNLALDAYEEPSEAKAKLPDESSSTKRVLPLRAVAGSPAISASYSEPDLTELPMRDSGPASAALSAASPAKVTDSSSGSTALDDSARKPLRTLAASGASVAYSEPLNVSAHVTLDKRPAMQQSLEHSASAPSLHRDTPSPRSDPYEEPSEAVVSASSSDPYQEPVVVSSRSAASAAPAAPRALAASASYSEPELASESSCLNMSAHIALDKKGPLQQSLEHRDAYLEPTLADVSAPAPRAAAVQPHAPAAPVAAVAKPLGHRDWNGEFQSILHSDSLTAMPVERTVALLRLSDEFCAEAQRIGQVIISELALPKEQKTFKPRDMGGVAGGQKYLEAGVFFKFARDAFGLYGGDEFSMKAAAHELSGLQAYLLTILAMERGAGEPALNVPLMAVVDYAGHRLIATCALPIGGRTLCYGSDDAGHTVHADDAALNALMEEAARLMYMKRHVAGNGNVAVREICGPTDIEGHRGRDGKYYVCDTARCFPPQAPSRMFVGVLMSVVSIEEVLANSHQRNALWSATELPLTTRNYVDEIKALLGARMTRRAVGDIEIFFNPHAPRINVAASWLVGFVVSGDAVVVPGGIKAKILYQLFRREFMMDVYKKPLSPDAFSGFGVHNRAEHNGEVREATRALLHEVIPAFAKKLEQHELVPATHHQLVAQLHAHGINARYLARVRSLLPSSETRLRNMLMVEMQIRCMKKMLCAALRQREPLEGEKSDLDTCRRVVADFLNRALGGSRRGQLAWSTALQVRLQLKFSSEGYSIDTKESMAVSSKLYVVQTLLDIAGVRLAADCLDRMQRNPDAFFADDNRRPFAPSDVDALEIRSRRLMSVDDTNDFFDTQLEHRLAAHPSAGAARLATIEEHIATVTALFGERSERSAMWYVIGAFYVARIAVALHRSASAGAAAAPLAADGDARRAFALAHRWLDAMLRCGDGKGQFEVELLAGLFYVRGLLARIEMPPNESFGVDVVAESFFRAAILAFDSLQSLSTNNSRDETETRGLRHPFRVVIADALLDVLLSREGEVRHGDVEALSLQFVDYMLEYPVGDFGRALGGVPALARFGSVETLSNTSRSARVRGMRGVDSHGRSKSVAELLVAFERDPSDDVYNEWRRMALRFNTKLGTYNYAALEASRVAAMHDVMRKDAYTVSRLPPTALAGVPVTLQFTLRAESAGSSSRECKVFEIHVYSADSQSEQSKDRLAFVSPDLTRFNRLSAHEVVRDRIPRVRVPFALRSCALRGGPPAPPLLRTAERCKHGHALVLQTRNDGNYARGWSCDVCRVNQSAAVRRFCCVPCGYDLCSECASARCSNGHQMLYGACAANASAEWRCVACGPDSAAHSRDQVHFLCSECDTHLCDVHAHVAERHREASAADADALLWSIDCSLFDGSSAIVTGTVVFQTRTWPANESFFALVATDQRMSCVSNTCLLYDGSSYARTRIPLFYSPIGDLFWSYGPWLGKSIVEVSTAWCSSDKYDALPRMSEPLFVRDGDGQVWTVGNNGAQWARQQRESPTPVLVRELIGKRVVSVAVGGFISDVHVVVATADGDVFAWGSNHHGELGVGDQVDRSTPSLVRALQGVNVQQVSAGCRTTLARTAQGGVWHWGAKASSEGRNSGEPLAPTALTAFPSGARHVNCAIFGDQCSAFAVVMLDGTAYVWGAVASRYVQVPARLEVPAGVGVLKVVFGREHMLMLDFDGRVYSFGDNLRGELASELPVKRRECVAASEVEVEFVPIAGLLDVRVVDIVVGSHQSVVLTDKGAVYHWGTHRPSLATDAYGERALPTEMHHYRVPTLLKCATIASFANVSATDSFLFLQPGAPPAPLNDEHIVEFRRRHAASAAISSSGAASAPRVELTVDASKMPLVRVSWRRRASPQWQCIGDRIMLLPKDSDMRDSRFRRRVPVIVPHASDSMSQHALATAEAYRERFGQASLRDKIASGTDWSIENMPPLGDNVGFFEFDVSNGVALEPGAYECVLYSLSSQGGNLAAECKVPAFVLAEQSSLVAVDWTVPTRVIARSSFTIQVRYASTTMPWDSRDSIALYPVADDNNDSGDGQRRAESRTSIAANGTVEVTAPMRAGVYSVVLEKQVSSKQTRSIANARLTVEKPGRKSTTLALDGEVFRFARKVSMSWDIESTLTPGQRDSELSSCYIMVLPSDITEDSPPDDRKPIATGTIDGKARGSADIYMSGDAGCYRAHIILTTALGTYFVASTHEFHIISEVPREVLQIAVTTAAGADGVVRVPFGAPVHVEWSVEPSFWNEYDGLALVRPGESQPCAYAQISTPNGSAALQAMVGEYVLEYRALGRTGQVGVSLDDLPRIVVGAQPVAAAAVSQQPTVPKNSNAAVEVLRVHESVALGGSQLHFSFALPASTKLSGSDFIGVYPASSEPVVTVPPIGCHRVETREDSHVALYTMPSEGQFVLRLWALDMSVGMVLVAQSKPFELTLDGDKVAAAAAATATAATTTAAAGGWNELLLAAGIGADDASAYEALLIANDFSIDLMADLDRDLLKDIGIDKVGHQVRILKEIAARLKK